MCQTFLYGLKNGSFRSVFYWHLLYIDTTEIHSFWVETPSNTEHLEFGFAAKVDGTVIPSNVPPRDSATQSYILSCNYQNQGTAAVLIDGSRFTTFPIKCGEKDDRVHILKSSTNEKIYFDIYKHNEATYRRRSINYDTTLPLVMVVGAAKHDEEIAMYNFRC